MYEYIYLMFLFNVKVCFQWSARYVAVATRIRTRSIATGITSAEESSRDFPVSIAVRDSAGSST